MQHSPNHSHNLHCYRIFPSTAFFLFSALGACSFFTCATMPYLNPFGTITLSSFHM
ncbi:hypothetical protein BDV06DRAFT_186404 [Aspergillus oleicola]